MNPQQGQLAPPQSRPNPHPQPQSMQPPQPPNQLRPQLGSVAMARPTLQPANSRGPSFDFRHKRARKARVSVVLDKKPLRIGMAVGAIITGGLWFWQVFFILNGMLGNLMLIPFGLCLTILIWYNGELKKLIVDRQQRGSISAILGRQLLGRLPNNPSPRDIAKIAGNLPAGRFFAARFGVSPDFVTNLSSASPNDTPVVWARSAQLDAHDDAVELSVASVYAALIFSIKDYQTYLAHLHLESEDIITGLSWQTHIQKIIDNLSKRRFYGGIGRDLTFGYTPLLRQLGRNITEEVERGGLYRRENEGRDDTVNQIIQLLSQAGRRNVTLVGEPGTGKTTVVYGFAQILIEGERINEGLRYNQVIELDASTLIANARNRGELESLMIRILNEAGRAKNIILFLDDAQLFLHDGTGAVDLSAILLPVLQGGGIRIILAMDQQQWLELTQLNPGLGQQMNRVTISPLDKTNTMRVVQDQLLKLEIQYRVTYVFQSLNRAYELADRFIHEQAFPGRAIKVLESAANFAEEGFVTARSVEQAIEKSFDIKVAQPDSIQERDTLLNMEGKIHERMINQVRAVQVVSDALRRARSGVRNQSRPMGTFLFLGPTGVGKTELSKSLADVYFGGEDRLVRVDLNEYSGENDVARLLDTGASNATGLCAQIAKQPFSVVLLDEIEKAHPNVLNVLLQMLDEGILRDTSNKEVSFRDAIIIATSNAGADIIRTHIERGESLEQFEEQFTNQLIDSGQFRPEFLNRFDEIVLFRPLNQEELIQVIDLIMKGLNKNLANQKIAVNLTHSAKVFLAKEGFDPRLGARPMRRMVQRTVENVVAQQLLMQKVAPGSVLELDEPDLQAALDNRTQTSASLTPPSA